MLSDKKRCYLCGRQGDLRPYGPQSLWLCFDCMKANPEVEAEAKRQFAAQIAGVHGPVVVGEEVGPYPAEHNPQLSDAIRALRRQDD